MSKYIAYPKNTAPQIQSNLWVLSKDDSQPVDQLEAGRVIVSYSYWKSHQAALQVKADHQEIGVFFSVQDDIVQEFDAIQTAMQQWSIIAVDFPIFRDGRGFSTAAILREEFFWKKELRAIGDVLIDQLVQMARVGFDAFVLREDQNLEFAITQLQRFPVKMQNDWRGSRTQLRGLTT
jgi:uncharacterized protein (DUF934 family)